MNNLEVLTGYRNSCLLGRQLNLYQIEETTSRRGVGMNSVSTQTLGISLQKVYYPTRGNHPVFSLKHTDPVV